MKTLSQPIDAAEIRARILTLTPTDAAQWGIMNVGQMICHGRGALLYAMSDTPVEFIPAALPPHALKHVALKLPVPWSRSFPAIPELRLGSPALITSTFDHDRDGLLTTLDSFCALTNHTRDHPYFHEMQHEDWMRWGYLHTDHHLRQFSR
ncbi:MAG: DUF1569 domain-containing protein [Acidobacteriaceae bacterium]